MLQFERSEYARRVAAACERMVEEDLDGLVLFRQESMYGEVGWGAACYRDDLRIERGQRTNQYSRLEMVIRPHSDSQVLDLKGKGTVMNRELFNRNFFVPIPEVDSNEFENLIDSWAIEYAEVYASKT